MWNASGTFATRFTADALTAHRTYVLPDQDGTVIVSSAGSIGIDRLSASSVFANVATISAIVSTRIDANQVSASGLFAVSLGVGQLTASAVTVVNTMTVGGTAVIGNLIVPGMISASTVGALSINVGDIAVTGRMSASAAAVTGILSASAIEATTLRVVNTISASDMSTLAMHINGALTVSGSTVLAGAVAMGSTLTVSGTVVAANLTVAGRISASAGAVTGTLSVSTLEVIVHRLLRQNAINEGGQIDFHRAVDNGFQYAIDCFGADSVDTALRFIDAKSGSVILQYNQSAAEWVTTRSFNIGGAFSVSGASVLVGPVALGSTLTVSGTVVAANLTVAGRISASAGAITGVLSASSVVATGVHSTNISAGTLTSGSLFVAGAMTVSGASVMLGAVAMGSTLTVSGTAVIGNLTVPGRISVSAVAVSAALSAEGIVITGGVLTIHRTDALGEGGQITLNRSTDNSSQFAIDVKGSGTATADNRLRIFNSQAGVELYAFDLLGRFSAQGINVVGTLSVGGSTTMLGPVGMGATLTVSGAVAAAQLTIAGNISASTIGANSRLSVGGLDIVRSVGQIRFEWPAGTGAAGIEIHPTRDVAGDCLIDFHATSATDYDFRIIRASGAAGNVFFDQTGGGAVLFRINAVSKFQLTLSGVTVIVPTYMQQTLTVSGAAVMLSTLSVSGVIAAVTRITTPVIEMSPASTATAGAVIGLDNLGLVATAGDNFSESGETIAQYGVSWDTTAGAAVCRISGNQGVIFYTGGFRKAQVNGFQGISTHNTAKAYGSVFGSAGGVSVPNSYNLSAVTRIGAGNYVIAFASDILGSACCIGSVFSVGVGFLGASDVIFGPSSARSLSAFPVLNGANGDAFSFEVLAQTVL